MATKRGNTKAGQKRSRVKPTPDGAQFSAGEKSKIRQALVELVLSAGKEIVNNVIKAAKAGNYLPAKYLFEFAGIADPLPEADEAGLEKVKSLTEILLETMREQTPGK